MKKHAEPIADISLEWVSGRIDMNEVKYIINEFLLYNDVAHYFTPCNYLDRNYLVPEGKPEFPLWASPRIEFKDFFVWRFNDKHVELSLIFYAYIEAEFSCVPKGHSSAYSIPYYKDPYSSSYASSYALHSNPYSSGYCAPHSYSGYGSEYYGLGIHDRFNLGSHQTTTTDRINCFADLIFRISAKKVVSLQ